MQTYIELALEMKMLHARLISPEDMVFDIRTPLKCAADEVQNRYGFVCIS
jgi:predicted metal-binding protein